MVGAVKGGKYSAALSQNVVELEVTNGEEDEERKAKKTAVNKASKVKSKAEKESQKTISCLNPAAKKLNVKKGK